MSVAEETINAKEISASKNLPILDRILNFLSSVRFGVTLLCILVVFSMIGMLVVQQNVNGFEPYYASLTPAEKLVYGKLGIFDIYHSWYFNLLLLILSLNIILASIDRFPSAWSYISTPKLSATRQWLLSQKEHFVAASKVETSAKTAAEIKTLFEKNGFKAYLSETASLDYELDADGRKDFSKTISKQQLIVFGERGRFNRIGAYIVHVALLTLFIGHFVALQTGFDADVQMIPGDATDKIQMIQFDVDKKEKFDVQLPFTLTCTDIQQTLINPQGSIAVNNTLDWRTQMKVDDSEYGTTVADISMNKPFNYRGYRFFQAQTIPVGNARSINLNVIPESGGEPIKVEIPRLGNATLADGTKIEYEEFLPDFSFNAEGKPDTRSGDYNNPVAVLSVTPPTGVRTRVFAFSSKLPDNIPAAAPKAGYKWRLNSFEKSPFAHVLSIKYDPFNGAFIAWYFGGFGLIGALIFVFFFSHKRIWALIEQRPNGQVEVVMAANTNRNQVGLEETFAKIVGGMRNITTD